MENRKMKFKITTHRNNKEFPLGINFFWNGAYILGIDLGFWTIDLILWFPLPS